MTRIQTPMIASTSKICTKPPKVYEDIIPSSHKIIKITAIVQSKSINSSLESGFISLATSPAEAKLRTDPLRLKLNAKPKLGQNHDVVAFRASRNATSALSATSFP